jgi:hypothetical protein
VPFLSNCDLEECTLCEAKMRHAQPTHFEIVCFVPALFSHQTAKKFAGLSALGGGGACMDCRSYGLARVEVGPCFDDAKGRGYTSRRSGNGAQPWA